MAEIERGTGYCELQPFSGCPLLAAEEINGVVQIIGRD
jgi:hypothetical protein